MSCSIFYCIYAVNKKWCKNAKVKILYEIALEPPKMAAGDPFNVMTIISPILTPPGVVESWWGRSYSDSGSDSGLFTPAPTPTPTPDSRLPTPDSESDTKYKINNTLTRA